MGIEGARYRLVGKSTSPPQAATSLLPAAEADHRGPSVFRGYLSNCVSRGHVVVAVNRLAKVISCHGALPGSHNKFVPHPRARTWSEVPYLINLYNIHPQLQLIQPDVVTCCCRGLWH